MTLPKFKKGDKVRCIQWSGTFLREGDEYIVREAKGGDILVDAVTPHAAFYQNGHYPERCFELVEAAVNSILDTAKELITGSRAEAYGSFSHNAQQQADLWNAYLRTEDGSPRAIEAMDVPAMMVLVKLMRLSGNNTHQDSWVDVAGFAGLAE